MAFPTSPIDGQIHNGFTYDSTVNCWNKTNFKKTNSDATRKSMEFLNGIKLQFGRTVDETVWPITITYLESHTEFPTALSDAPRNGFYSTAGTGGVMATLTSFPMYVRDATNDAETTLITKGHWATIGK